jgi:hypothetical protein
MQGGTIVSDSNDNGCLRIVDVFSSVDLTKSLKEISEISPEGNENIESFRKIFNCLSQIKPGGSSDIYLKINRDILSEKFEIVGVDSVSNEQFGVEFFLGMNG